MQKTAVTEPVCFPECVVWGMLLRLATGAEESDFLLVLCAVDTPVTDLLGGFLKDRDVTLLSLEPGGSRLREHLVERGQEDRVTQVMG